MILLFWQWRPIPDLVWAVTDPANAAVIQTVSLAGWTIVLVSTFLISHFELFGVTQVVTHWLGRAVPSAIATCPAQFGRMAARPNTAAAICLSDSFSSRRSRRGAVGHSHAAI
ncbi:MAG TPA: hypothetical protein VF601_15390 [Beijerinckiaceae bacterium]|jgi:protein-S-isoprenylcysteine O-methyltransferase Ste14